MDFTNVKIVTFVPAAQADAVRQALGASGAGIIGEYSFCSYSVLGKGRFTPSKDAKPYLGTANVPEIVEEERIEVTCNRSIAKDVMAALKQAHPYEEAAMDIYPLVDESSL